MSLSARLLDQARREGCAGVGVCDVAPFADTEHAIRRRRDDGLHGTLKFTYRDPATASDVRSSFPWARRLLVAAWAYVPGAGSPGPARSGTGRVARFATADHYVPLRGALERVAAVLEYEGHRAAVLVDDNRLVDRAAAVRAGVGWWGKSSMVLVPGAGPWVLLGSVATDAELSLSEPMRRDCGTCEACLPACPTGAIVAPGVLDARRCLAHWLQAPGVIPRDLRPAVGDRIYGCDDCLDACPPGHPIASKITIKRGRHHLAALLDLEDGELLDRFRHFYVPKRRARYLRRNILVALGNVGGPGATETLARWARHQDWLLRVHAVWSLAKLGQPDADDVLAALAATETHRDVVDELVAAGVAAGSQG